MEFTVTFTRTAAGDVEYSIPFAPNPLWSSTPEIRDGVDVICVPDRTQPHLQPGFVAALLATLPALVASLPQKRQIRIVAWPWGYGRQEDLDTLIADFEDEGFAVEVSVVDPAPLDDRRLTT